MLLYTSNLIRTLTIVLVGFVAPLFLLAQQTPTDSLLATLPADKDTNYIIQLQKILPQLNNLKTKMQYAKISLELSKILKYQPGIAEGHYCVGEYHRLDNEHIKALEHFQEVLPIANAEKNYPLAFDSYRKQAYCLRQLGQTESAYQQLLNALKLSEELGDEKLQAKAYYQLGDFFRLQKETAQAIAHFEKSKAFYASINDDSANCRLTFYIGMSHKQFEAVDKQRKGLKILEELLDGPCGANMSLFQKAVTLNNLGSSYVNIDELQRGESYLLQALDIKKKINNSISLAYTLNELSSLALKKKDFNAALSYAEQAYERAKGGQDVFVLEDIYENLAISNYKKKNYKESYEHLFTYKNLTDSIRGTETTDAIAQLSSNYETQKNEKALLQKDLLIAQQKSQLNQYVMIGTSLLAILFLGFFWYQGRLHKRKLEAKKLQELDQLKSNFFNNITHEFRTPLTIILNTFSQEELGAENVKLSKEEINSVQRNARRLENLINQLLDLSKLEAGKMRLQLTENELSDFLRTLTHSFRSLAEQKDIALQFVSQWNGGKIFFDADKLEKIMTNLLYNAIKFTPQGGEINVLLLPRDEQLEIVVKDNGIGISPEALPYIFDRFQQVDHSVTRKFEGSGIGLALVQQLAKVHLGSIHVESQLGKGTAFTLALPAHKKAYDPQDIIEQPFLKLADVKRPLIHPTVTASAGDTIETATSNLPLILVMEDDPDLRALLRRQLDTHYQILEAENGAIGLEIAVQQIPDLIISDVMMPEKSGYEVCEALKKDIKTSHIPIILLTAKATQEEKLEGLSLGADSYLIKPFDKQELDVRIQNLITQRQLLQQRYAQEIVYRTSSTPVKSRQDIFIQNLLETIETELSNDSFGVEQLAAAVHMSRSQLFRKLKALTNKTPNVFLREIRLQRAKELLESEAGNVSEIASMVGFANPNYFYKCFKDFYGQTPGDVLKKVS